MIQGNKYSGGITWYCNLFFFQIFVYLTFRQLCIHIWPGIYTINYIMYNLPPIYIYIQPPAVTHIYTMRYILYVTPDIYVHILFLQYIYIQGIYYIPHCIYIYPIVTCYTYIYPEAYSMYNILHIYTIDTCYTYIYPDAYSMYNILSIYVYNL